MGVDIVVYSMSKYMNGHSDVVMGALVLNDTELFDRLAYFRNGKYLHLIRKVLVKYLILLPPPTPIRNQILYTPLTLGHQKY